MPQIALLISVLVLGNVLISPACAENAQDATLSATTPTQAAPTEGSAEVTSTDAFIQALASTYNTNPQLKAAREALKATDEDVAQAISGFRPKASAEFEQGRARNDTTGSWNYRDTKSRGLTIEQPIFNGGETLYGYQSAKKRVEAARAELRETEQQVLFDAVAAYSDVYEKQSVMELAQGNVDILKKQLDVTNDRFNVGELTQTDVAQAKSRLAQADANLRQAEGDLKAARATFARVVGYPADNLLPDSKLPPLPASLDEALTIAQQSNPTLLAAQLTEKARDYNINQHIGALLPDVSLRGNMSRTSGGSFVNKLDTDSLTVNVHVPLYQSGAEYSRIREAKNQYQQSKYLSMDTQNAVVEAVTRAYENYEASLAIIESTKASVEAADIARDGVREESDFGVRTVLDALDAEQESFRNRVNLVKAERSKILHAYRLMASIGKLSAQELALPVQYYNVDENYNDVKWQPAGF
jgi:TolC family type I secretion outer membrane protein